MNRVASDMNTWRNREERFEKLFPGTLHSNRPFLEEKLQYLHSVQIRYGTNANDEERLTLRILKQERDKLEREVYPSLLTRFIRALVRIYKQKRVNDQQVEQAENKRQSLFKAIAKAGFGSAVSQLEKQLSQGQASFSVPVSYYVNPGERMDFKLDFNADTNGQCRLDTYQASLNQEGHPEVLRQYSFSSGQLESITAYQVYNMLAGRAVLFEYTDLNRKSQSVWKQFDFNDRDASGNFRIKEFHETYRYDLDKELQKLPLKELTTDETRDVLLNQLKNGNRIEVTVEKNGLDQKFFIEANPHARSVTIYDAGLKKVHAQSLEDPKEIHLQNKKQLDDTPSQKSGHVIKISGKQSRDASEETQPEKKQSTRRRLGIS